MILAEVAFVALITGIADIRGMKITDNCDKALTRIDYTELHDLQGDLKDMYEADYLKLKRSLEKHGFRFPFYTWYSKKEKKWYTMDGHGRLRLFSKEGVVNEKGTKEFAVVPIVATTKQEAKELLLLVNSQYQKMTQEGFENFIADIEDTSFLELTSLPVLTDLDINVDDFFGDEKPPSAPTSPITCNRGG